MYVYLSLSTVVRRAAAQGSLAVTTFSPVFIPAHPCRTTSSMNHSRVDLFTAVHRLFQCCGSDFELQTTIYNGRRLGFYFHRKRRSYNRRISAQALSTHLCQAARCQSVQERIFQPCS
ncbi:hypothetical protein Mapa_016893 [Marchantia paleacea]|nr:hypothetical protein Mapa_016893 [Marchantia paleacea]